MAEIVEDIKGYHNVFKVMHVFCLRNNSAFRSKTIKINFRAELNNYRLALYICSSYIEYYNRKQPYYLAEIFSLLCGCDELKLS